MNAVKTLGTALAGTSMGRMRTPLRPLGAPLRDGTIIRTMAWASHFEARASLNAKAAELHDARR